LSSCADSTRSARSARSLNSRLGGPGSVLLAVAIVSVALPGCYRRVVGVKNNPGYEGKVYEPNLKDGEENAMVELFTVERTRPVSK
jgi:hypothetical protein